MLPTNFHISDQDLLLLVDGELSSRRAAEIREHFSACWTCRTRMAELERTIANFVHFYRQDHAGVPRIEGPRALLKARMAERTASPRSGKYGWFSRIPEIRIAGALAAAVLLAGLIGGITQYRNPGKHSKRMELPAMPDVTLTPGAIQPITTHDACSASFSTNDPVVPDSLKQEVLRKYRISVAASNTYEIDYLVTPRLGGTASIRNLWPEPSGTVWNSRVKDELEDRLRDLVCSGKLDLSTAQREISQNWVAAYKKYFHTSEPLPERLRGQA